MDSGAGYVFYASKKLLSIYATTQPQGLPDLARDQRGSILIKQP
jgi:hypothetical protein